MKQFASASSSKGRGGEDQEVVVITNFLVV